jgi:hypothetical protein
MESKVSFSEKSDKFGKTPCVIELQAFRGNANEFIVKELAILDLQTGAINYFLFKPPFPFKCLHTKPARTNKWVMSHFHHISWSDGNVDYSELDNIMYYYCDKYKTIYTTGSEKCRWINIYTSSSRIYDCSACKINKSTVSICIGVKSEKHNHSNCAMAKSLQLASAIYSSYETQFSPPPTSSGGGGH